ncbi:MAG TPA: histidine kinase dimerization/phospho-acceptor domain-containing protein, partial [Ferruginibacter sp.]|nr:histidine kinase dimerization/phospho-acceptor domain-containing protein [Ferruginibacter sp.]
MFLFMLLIIVGAVSLYYFVNLREDAKNILADNYESLDYSHRLLQHTGSRNAASDATFKIADSLIKLQENNITEAGEEEATIALRNAFMKYRNGDTSLGTKEEINQHIYTIMQLNMAALQRKNLQVAATSQKAFNTIVLISCIIFLIAFVFLVNFPSIVVTPIKKLTEAIGEISAKNYKHRIHLESHDEFQQLGDSINNMTELLEEFENSNLNKLIFEKTRAEAVINSLKDASIGIDKKGKVLFVNEQALNLLGLSRTESVGKGVDAICKQNDLFNYLIHNESNAPFKIVVEDKENYYIKETIEVVQGEAANKVIVLKNITSFKEMDVAKTNFIATVSHELKTPLASSDFSLKLLEDQRVGTLSDEQRELVMHLKKDNQRMLKILSELLNMSQVEAGKIQLNISAVNLNELIDISATALDNTFKEKNIQLQKDLQPLPVINADADKLNWVINNFFTNAIKYSQPGGNIKIASYQSGNKVSVAVTDDGPGIDPSYYDRIFERYFQIPGRSD